MQRRGDSEARDGLRGLATARICAAKLALLLAVLMVGVLSLSGCRPSDALKEIVMDPWSSVEDLNRTTRVNSPYGEEETDELPALDVRPDAREQVEEQNVVVYGTDANFALATPHTVFDIDPLFKGKGVEASDAVKLVASDAPDAIDHEVDSAKIDTEKKSDSKKSSDESKKKSDSKKSSDKPKKKTAKKSKAEAPESEIAGQGGEQAPSSDGGGKSKQQQQEQAGGSAQTTGDDGDESQSADEGDADSDFDEGGEGDDGSEGDGEGSVEEGSREAEPEGYSGLKKTYIPGESLDDPPTANSIVAIGQAAVMVQAIGGRGALSGMDRCTYEGLTSKGADASYASAFKDVFADELADGFSESAIVFDGDGADAKEDIPSIDAVVEAAGENGVIVVPQDKVDASAWLTKKQAKAVDEAGITIIPVSFSTAQGIEDAATVVGKILKSSKVLDEGWNSVDMAKQYRKTFDGIVKACAKASNDGKLGTSNGDDPLADGSNSTIIGGNSAYQKWGADGGSFSTTGIYAVIATDFDMGASYTNISEYDTGIDISDGVLFLHPGHRDSPLSFFAQVAGVFNTAAHQGDHWLETYEVGQDGVFPLWQYWFADSFDKSCFEQVGLFKRIIEDPTKGSEYNKNAWISGLSSAYVADVHNVMSTRLCGIGSVRFPYLIVSASSDGSYSGEDVRSHVVASSAKPFGAYHVWTDKDVEENSPSLGDEVTIGRGVSDKEALQENFADVVRVNPEGLLSRWTEGSAESVLEAAWLAQVFSEQPKVGDYVPADSRDMEKFSVDIGGSECTSFRQAVEQFYRTFYRYDTSSSYSAIVPDE